MYYSTVWTSPVGEITMAADRNSLVGLWIQGQKYYGGGITKEMNRQDNLLLFQRVKQWLDRYFSGKRPSVCELPLAPVGGEFRQGVWEILCTIPYGETITYGEIAKKMAVRMNRSRMSAQAVGGAVGHNPISIIIPCHRVLGKDGDLTGYAGGIKIKQRLLQLEGIKDFRLPVSEM